MENKISNPEPTFITNLREFIIEVVQTEMYKLKKFEPEPKQDEWMTINEVIKFLKVSKPTLWDMTNRGQFTKYFIDGKPRYKRSELDEAFIGLKVRK